MPEEEKKEQKITAVYSPLRISWRNVLLGTVIALLIVAIGVFAFSYYTPNANPVAPIKIKSGTNSNQAATDSVEATSSAETSTSSAEIATESSQNQ